MPQPVRPTLQTCSDKDTDTANAVSNTHSLAKDKQIRTITKLNHLKVDDD